MPSKSAKQAFFMRIAAHDKDFADKAGIEQSVAKDFYEADKKKEAEEKPKQKQKK
jgi:hypothetical protein